ncbi:hypothetical protein CDAR_85331 [Caerostris darwini]|uniref:C2H2-type domain-containing protein n=1 Tax=Caerostris darwini TaxID=1538125 RepID=A0AAV4VKB1_9ARAC|nr:hypothetical protein CDAR_85331 [Caerostris darwini]
MSTSNTWQTIEFPTCNVCGSEFLILDLLIEHCKEQHKILPYVCEHCGRADKYWIEFERHQLVHSEERPELTAKETVNASIHSSEGQSSTSTEKNEGV